MAIGALWIVHKLLERWSAAAEADPWGRDEAAKIDPHLSLAR